VGVTEHEAVFEISTYDQHLIEENARERFSTKYGDQDERDAASAAGFITDNTYPEITDEGWVQLNKDIQQLEQNALRWLKKTFVHVRNDGHADETLVGVVWFDPTKKRQAELINLASASPGASERIDMVDASFGDLAASAFDGVSDFGSSILGGAIHFSEVTPESWEAIEATLADTTKVHRMSLSGIADNIRYQKPPSAPRKRGRDPGDCEDKSCPPIERPHVPHTIAYVNGLPSWAKPPRR